MVMGTNSWWEAQEVKVETCLPRECSALFTHKCQNESEEVREQTADTKRM